MSEIKYKSFEYSNATTVKFKNRRVTVISNPENETMELTFKRLVVKEDLSVLTLIFAKP